MTTLTDSLLFYSVPRFDVKGRALLQRLEKYYPVEFRFTTPLIARPQRRHWAYLGKYGVFGIETRYSQVYVGNLDKYEVDFCCCN